MNLITRTVTSNYFLFCDKTREQMFYFDSYTTRPLLFGKLVLSLCMLSVTLTASLHTLQS